MEKGFTIWFTGLPSSGKTTVSKILVDMLRKRRVEKIEVLDGDVIRTNLSKGLGFSKEDRDTNIKRIAFVCHLLSRNGVVAVAAAISPYREIRDQARKLIGDFVEVYVKCPVEVCAQRDPKGNYQKAFTGEIKNFTGVNDPYEEPIDPEVVVETDLQEPRVSAEKIISKLEQMGYLPTTGSQAYTEEESKVIEDRLADLGYL